MNFRGVLIIILLSLSTAINAQMLDDYWLPDSARNDEQRISTQITMGSSVASNFNGGAAFSTFIAPSISYRIDPRWSLSVGTAIMNTNLDNWTSYQLGDGRQGNLNVNHQQIFVQASYAASENLTLTGTVYQHLWNLSSFGDSPLENSLRGSSYSMGAEYRFGNGFSLGLQVSRSNGFNPYNRAFMMGGPSRFGGGFGIR